MLYFFLLLINPLYQFIEVLGYLSFYGPRLETRIGLLFEDLHWPVVSSVKGLPSKATQDIIWTKDTEISSPSISWNNSPLGKNPTAEPRIEPTPHIQ